MNIEQVFTGCTEGTIKINDIGRAKGRKLNPVDVRYALAGMKRREMLYTEYVYLLQDEKLQDFRDSVLREYLGERKFKRLMPELIEVACFSQRCPGKVSDKQAIKYIRVGWKKWKETYKDEYYLVQSILAEINDNVIRHIWKKLK